jgi:hypothetical protein
MTLIVVFVAFMREQAKFDIVANSLDSVSSIRFNITNCFTDVIGICDARHIFFLRGGLPTRHQTRGHNEYR